MIALWKAEYQKTRRRYLMLFVLGMSAVVMAWALSGKINEDGIRKGWYMLLYQMPVTNTLMLPVMAMLLSFRLGDLEHKNGMLKQLCCVVDKGKLFDAKLLYGLGLMFAGIALQWCAVIADGFFRHHFGGVFLWKEYLLLLLFTIAPAAAIYVLQHTLAMCFTKPAAPYVVGIVGEFAGVMSLFLPYRWFSQTIPWGYFGALMIVGMEYDKETRISTYFYREINWRGFAAIITITIVIYVTGRIAFCKKEE